MAISYKEIQERLKILDVEILCGENEWKGVKSKGQDGKYVTHKYYFKDINGHEFYTSIDSVINKKQILCPICSSEKKRQSQLMPYNEAYNRVVDVGCIPLFTEEEWEGTHKKYWFKDMNGHKFYRRYNDVEKKHETLCNDCVRLNISKKQKLSEKEYIKRNQTILERQNLKVLTEYNDFTNMNDYVTVECEKCYKIYNVIYTNIWNRQDCCRDCGNRIPYGEAKLISLLKEKGIIYEYQAVFEDLKYKEPLRIDFLFRNAKIAIEIQSNLHKKYIPHLHHNYNNFLIYQERDKIKKEYLETNGFKIIYIDEDDYKFDEKIKEIVKELKMNKLIDNCEKKKIKWIDIARCYNFGAIVSYDAKTGILYKEYPSVIYASEIEGITATSIYNVLSGKINYAKGLVFKYAKDKKETITPIDNVIIFNRKGVTVCNKNTGKTKYFKTLIECEKYINLNRTIISGYFQKRIKLPKRISEQYEFYQGNMLNKKIKEE